jgi:hypothetical protein
MGFFRKKSTLSPPNINSSEAAAGTHIAEAFSSSWSSSFSAAYLTPGKQKRARKVSSHGHQTAASAPDSSVNTKRSKQTDQRHYN